MTFLWYTLEIIYIFKKSEKKMIFVILSPICHIFCDSFEEVKENKQAFSFCPTWFDPVAFCLQFLNILCRTVFIVKMNV